MAYYEEESQFPFHDDDWILSTTTTTITTIDQGDQDGAESDYSLDYEYLGPRQPNYRNEQDADSDASELSCCHGNNNNNSCLPSSPTQFGFDMWDEDPYSTNDFTWESNDMRLTGFIKKRQRQLTKMNAVSPWSSSPSFWRKEKGWPKQLPNSSSTTNHDQSANALSLVLSDYGISETLHAVYRDRIVECGKFSYSAAVHQQQTVVTATTSKNDTTYLDDETVATTTTNNDATTTTTSPSSSSSLFNQTHVSISLPKTIQEQHQQQQQQQQQQQLDHLQNSNNNKGLLSKFIPYTKYIKRSQFPVIFPQDAYLALSFEPLCLAEKYGYMAIGGVEGEFELYCCMDTTRPPIKIWGTKFKGKNNIIFMTNAVQIVRWSTTTTTTNSNKNNDDYRYFLIACMNDAGILIYDLPNHHQCQLTTTRSDLYCHIKCFDHVPINDARVSPDGHHLVCVGDDACIFHLIVSYQKNQLVFGTPQKIKISPSVLSSSSSSSSSADNNNNSSFSSQYVAWSKSSIYFAHTSDTHNYVIVWRTRPQFEMLYRIDAGGYTYAIQFHPHHEGVLVFSNRYGYFHTVHLDEAIVLQDPLHITRVIDFDQHHLEGDDTIHRTHGIYARQEITMISFRGEKNRKLRILAKINGLQWSHDGCYLYVSTKKRVLAYEFLKSSCHVQSLEKMAGLQALSILEEETRQKKRKQEEEIEVEEETTAKKKRKRKRKLWDRKWEDIPPHVRNSVLGDTYHLASHW